MTQESGEKQERIDALISAAMDDELLGGDRAELDRMIAEDATVAARVREFHQIDAGLRTLGTEDVTGERLAESFAAIEARLASATPSSWRQWGVPLVLAAAAALALTVLVPGSETTPNEGERLSRKALAASDSAEAVQQVDELEADALGISFDEALAVALGYAEGPNGTSLDPEIAMEDFEIIDQLELLEYLASRDAEGRG